MMYNGAFSDMEAVLVEPDDPFSFSIYLFYLFSTLYRVLLVHIVSRCFREPPTDKQQWQEQADV